MNKERNKMIKCINNPLFNDNDIMIKISQLYKLNVLTDVLNSNIKLNDNTLSYIIITDTYFIILIRQLNNSRLLIRSVNNIYLDVITINDYKINTYDSFQLDNTMTFKVENENKSILLFNIIGDSLSFNSNFIGINLLTKVNRILIAKHY